MAVEQKLPAPGTKNEAGHAPIVEMRGIEKRFGSVTAVAHADLVLYPGEVHALVGGNGAGKSTLISCLAGMYKPTGGEIYFEGRPVSIPKPKSARDLGIETIHQQLSLVDKMDVVSNMFLGREVKYKGLLGKLGFLNNKKMREQTRREFTRLQMNMPNIDERVQNLSGGQRQGIACARAMMGSAPKVLIMDEPTAALGVKESREVFRLMRACRDEGAAVVLISHDMNEVFEISDTISVIYLGTTIAHVQTREQKPLDIVSLITGVIDPPQEETARA